MDHNAVYRAYGILAGLPWFQLSAANTFILELGLSAHEK